MNFTDKVQQQFEKSGWKSERNVLDEYNTDFINKAPEFLVEFLKEYGGLEVADAKDYKSDVINKLQLNYRHTLLISEDKDELDYLLPLINKEVYLFAYFDPDGYYIGVDEEGKVYMIGDYVFHIANSLEEGIEILIKDDWSKGYIQLNENDGTWNPSEHYSGWNT
ncbi:SUKH-3 domain-containing protein [Lacinutrix salivirga]